ncbi:hypothetical protein Tco_0896077 [Tanacetum coccineum]
MGHLIAKFELTGFECLVNINEQIIPRFVLESFSLTVEEFSHILKIPFKGHVSYTDMWSLDYLAISTLSKGRYKTTPPSPSVINSLIQTPRQDENVDDNDEESSHSSTPSLPQLISSLSNVVPEVFENLPHES